MSSLNSTILFFLEVFMRKFEKISFKQFAKDVVEGNYNDIILPNRKSKYSAGYDFISFLDITLKPDEIKYMDMFKK